MGDIFEAKLSMTSKNYFPRPQSTYFVIAPLLRSFGNVNDYVAHIYRKYADLGGIIEFNIGISSTSSTLNEKFEIDNKIAHHITNIDLKSLRIRNLGKIVLGHLNIDLIRKKFDFLAHQVQGNIDILIIQRQNMMKVSLQNNFC